MSLGYADVRFGDCCGYPGYPNFGLIHNQHINAPPSAGTVAIDHSTITDSSGTGISIANGALLVANSTIANNGWWGGTIWSWDGISVSSSTLVLTNSTIANNTLGLRYSTVSGGTATISNNVFTGNGRGGVSGGTLEQPLAAENNYWGSDTGPGSRHEVCYYDGQNQPVYNPATGSGDSVSCFVDFDPWSAGSTPTPTSTPTSTPTPTGISSNMTFSSDAIVTLGPTTLRYEGNVHLGNADSTTFSVDLGTTSRLDYDSSTGAVTNVVIDANTAFMSAVGDRYDFTGATTAVINAAASG